MKQFFIAIFSLVWMGSVFSQNSKQELSQMKELLKEISINAIELGYVNAKLSPKQLEAKWLGFEPATSEAIHKLEKRLGIELPSDYKAFMQLTNGFLFATGVDPSFCAVEKVAYLKKTDPYLIEVWSAPGTADIGEKLKTAIQVGGFDEEQYFYLIPPSKENPNWEYWVFANWAPGETVYHSLADYFKTVLEYTVYFMEKE
jgi:hypothetical protein